MQIAKVDLEFLARRFRDRGERRTCTSMCSPLFDVRGNAAFRSLRPRDLLYKCIKILKQALIFLHSCVVMNNRRGRPRMKRGF
jgi:hypothetical protein